MTLYEDGIKINKNISFGDITENSYDEKNGIIHLEVYDIFGNWEDY